MKRDLKANDKEKAPMKQAIRSASLLTAAIFMTTQTPLHAQTDSHAIPVSVATTQKPPLHGQKWMAITGKPLGATAGAAMFQRGGNAVDAACAMIAATSTMWDVLSWGGETQTLIYDPRAEKVVAINGLGVRESAFVWFLTRAGMDPATALALSLASYVIAVGQGVLGGAVHLYRQFRDPSPTPVAEAD